MRYVDILPTATETGSTTEVVNGFTYFISNYNQPVGRGFDKNPNTVLRSGVNGTGYVEITFPKEYLIGKYSITVGYGYAVAQGGDMKTWKIEAKVNGAWVIVHNGSHEAVVETLDFEFAPVLATALRITVLSRHSNNSFGFLDFSLCEIVYDSFALVYHDNVHKTYNEVSLAWETIGADRPSKEVFISDGIDMYLRSDFSIFNSFDTYELIYLSDNIFLDYVEVLQTVESFNVYDYISENPQAVVYTESTDDIVVSTSTEPYDLYDEFGDEIEALLYIDDEVYTEADLILEANWSPVDELIGDFEVVTWSNEPQATAQRVLELTAIPKPQFVKLANPKRLYGYLDDVLVIDASKSYRDEMRYLFTDEKATKWYAWDFKSKKFVEVDASTHELILKNGMKHTDITRLTKDDWRTWTKDYINIGVFLRDNVRDTITSVVETISYEDYLPRDTVELEKANFYILNTTAKIDIELNGNVLKGFLSDNDLTRVQYRVLLNGGNYYPADGSFTKLGDSPQNIELIIGSKDIKIDDWNTIKIEFQDFFGTTDYWSTNFMGTYSGLMFKDVYGQYYSSEIGEILQYLDFGVIIAGQTTIEHEIVLRNQYGYDVKNVHIYANTSNFPTGLECEFSPTQTPFTSHPELRLSGVLKNNDEISFFVRLKTVLGATPDANGVFDIIVRADRA